jgi:predicted RNA binding protein YcfA (HicA-like mRNA interferase family)
MRFNDLERILLQHGFILVRKSKHVIYRNGMRTVAVPHQRMVNRMLSQRILKEIGYAPQR